MNTSNPRSGTGYEVKPQLPFWVTRLQALIEEARQIREAREKGKEDVAKPVKQEQFQEEVTETPKESGESGCPVNVDTEGDTET